MRRGSTVAERFVFWVLAHGPEERTFADLMETTGLTYPGVRKVVARLRRRGVVSVRVPRPTRRGRERFRISIGRTA